MPILLDKILPMSLLPRESLLAVLGSVYDSQKHSTDCSSLATPMKDFMSYYDAKLTYEFATVEQGLLEQGLLFTLAIPLASRQTSLHVYGAHVIPMLENILTRPLSGSSKFHTRQFCRIPLKRLR